MEQDIANKILAELLDMRKDIHSMDTRLYSVEEAVKKIPLIKTRLCSLEQTVKENHREISLIKTNLCSLEQTVKENHKEISLIKTNLCSLEQTVKENHKVVMMNLKDQIAFNQDVSSVISSASRFA